MNLRNHISFSALKQLPLYSVLWMKRLLKRPFFLFTLFLIPFAVFFLEHLVSSDDSILQIALYVDGSTPDALCRKLEKDLLQISNATVRFYPVATEEALRKDVSESKAVSGYLIPAALQKSLTSYAEDKKPIFTAIQREEEMSNRIVDEILLSKIYQTHAFQILERFLKKKLEKSKLASPLDMEFTREHFTSYQSHELLFRFEYASGKENTLLNRHSGEILILPLRGFLSVMILLSAMAASLLWYEDKKSGFLLVCSRQTKKLCNLVSLLVPAVFAGILGMCAIGMTEVSETFPTELLSMAGFLFACISLVHFLRTILGNRERFLSAIPVLTIGSLLFCPVFVDLSLHAPVVSFLRVLFPTHYYLRSIYQSSDLWKLLLYGVIFLVLQKIWKHNFH